MQNFGFILASYLSTVLIIGAVALWLVLDHKKQKGALQALEARGVRRRAQSATAAADPANPTPTSEQVTK
ncbi:heme exporter protein CcmD [Pararhizobium sp. IMCC21322]|uniref:heme exporter protein CcmD n=1 Tax=Pararhizobium sp. IMCC21322 TaxID=3067903 RepID=UPI0027415073|nr:heme exporter protein CcmD [Pararhizobium sp. IMCC21322]